MVKGKIKKPIYKRWWFIAIVVLVVIGAVAGGSDSEDTSAAPKQSSAKTTPVQKEPVEEVMEFDRSLLDIDEYLGHMVNEIMGETTNMEKATLVIVSDGDEGIKDVTLNANDNLTLNMTVGGMLIDASDYFEAISQDEKVMKLKAVSLIYQMTLVDKYGAEDDYPVQIITLSTETMGKINWENFLYDNLPEVADTYFLHRVLQPEE
jgi:hypothetical protein